MEFSPEEAGGPMSLARASYYRARVGDLDLRVSVCNALERCTAILYVLDPEPELFGLCTAHLLGRAGYGTTSPLRGCAIVGVGHHPSLYGGGPAGWDVQAMRELRR